jgi:hypothetical protein
MKLQGAATRRGFWNSATSDRGITEFGQLVCFGNQSRHMSTPYCKADVSTYTRLYYLCRQLKSNNEPAESFLATDGYNHVARIVSPLPRALRTAIMRPCMFSYPNMYDN